MLQFLEESEADVVALRIAGDVDKQDYDLMLPVLDEKIKQYGKIRIYAEVQDVEEYTLKAIWDEIKFDFKHAADFSRVAVVGDQKWVDTLSIVANPFTSADVKYFNFEHSAEAKSWLHERA